MREVGTTNKLYNCPLCQHASGLASTFEAHVSTMHGTTIQALWDSVNSGPGVCSCGCGGATSWLGWHKGYSPSLKGHWRRGKTKDNDAAIAKASRKIREGFANGRTSWSKGLTKETDLRVKRKGEASGEGLRAAYADGTTTPWSKGLTKETDTRLAATSAALKLAYAEGRKSCWTSDSTPETKIKLASMAAAHRLSKEDISQRIESPGRYRLASSLDEYSSTYDIVDVECVACGHHTRNKIGAFIHRPVQPLCPRCSPSGSSAAERELAEFVESLVGQHNVVRNDRTLIPPLELDVFVPSRMFAVEFNGLYWHSVRFKHPQEHCRKSKACKRKGVRLLHVFEDEWRDRRPIVESMVKARLGVGMRKVDARKCVVKRVETAERRAFFTANHLDGDVNAGFAYGLYDGGTLVQCMSIRSPIQARYRDVGMLEVARSCSLLDTYVRGGMSRLLAAVRLHRPGTRLMTYVDERLGNDAAYRVSGWSFATYTTAPSFWWTDDVNRYNRLRIRADKSRGMSERQVADEARMTKIFGCRNSVYIA